MRFGLPFLLLGGVVAFPACGSDEIAPEVVEGCRGWVRAACAKDAECLVPEATRSRAIDDCVAKNDKDGTCTSKSKAKSCDVMLAVSSFQACMRVADGKQCKDCDPFFGCGGPFCFLSGCPK